jgi:prepilin-type N-terminal cleavage/methylation domain-containing protein
MKALKSIKSDSKGFTLVEIIVTIVAAGILGAIFVNFMGTALDASWNAIEIVRDEAGGEGVIEQIIADYVAAINSDPPDILTGALKTIRDNIDAKKYGDNVTWTYIEFDAGGAEIDRGASPTDNLKVVLQASGQLAPAITGRYPLTMILANTRREADDQVVIY